MNFNKKVLSNGTRLITIPMPESPTTTVMVLVEAGSKYETAKTSGLSHFLEHFVFKGTTRRPKPVDLSRELDALGAQYNAFTAQEFTGYYAKAHKNKTEKILDIVSDMYLNPVLPESELEKEKGVIIQEIHMYEDEPMRHVQDVFMELLHGNQPAGWNIAGTPNTVASFTRADLVTYRTAHYVPEATTVIVSGAFDDNTVVQVENIFKILPSVPKSEKKSVTESQKKPAILLTHKETDQTHLVLGVRAFGVSDSRARTLKVLAGVLGGGMSSRLFVKLRDELGLCYYVSASPDLYTDHGAFQIAVGADTKKVTATIEAVIAEMRRLTKELVSDAELRKVKDFLIGNLYLALESSDELAQFYGMQEILRRPIKIADQVAKEIEGVTALDIQKVAQDIFHNAGLNLAMIGPFKDKKPFLSLLKF